MFDLLVAAIGLVVLSPLFLLMTVWIRVDSPGPVFYRGERIARGGGTFRIFKFRSMVVNAEKSGQLSTSNDDARVTASGRFIRRFKLDEFAQLLNVFVGDMSLVGPRPEVLKYSAKYTGELAQVLDARPGITDWASIWNNDEGAVLAGYPDADRAFEEMIQPTKLRLQLRYVRERSFVTDLRILLYTVRTLLDRDYYPPELRDTPRLTRRV
jgi:lipopolysaccharide/colanic/teichoic acid biosynthesis glycosyltransferase